MVDFPLLEMAKNGHLTLFPFGIDLPQPFMLQHNTVRLYHEKRIDETNVLINTEIPHEYSSFFRSSSERVIAVISEQIGIVFDHIHGNLDIGKLGGKGSVFAVYEVKNRFMYSQTIHRISILEMVFAIHSLFHSH